MSPQCSVLEYRAAHDGVLVNSVLGLFSYNLVVGNNDKLLEVSFIQKTFMTYSVTKHIIQ